MKHYFVEKKREIIVWEIKKTNNLAAIGVESMVC